MWVKSGLGLGLADDFILFLFLYLVLLVVLGGLTLSNAVFFFNGFLQNHKYMLFLT